MKSFQKKKIGIIGFVCFLIFIIFMGILFFYFYEKRMESFTPFSVIYSASNEVNIKSKLPISDTLGKTLTGDGTAEGIQGFIDFSIQNTGNRRKKYYLLLREENIESQKIRDNYVKLYLTDRKDEPYPEFLKNSVPTYSDFPVFSVDSSSKVLYEGILEKGETYEFRLRVWLSDSYIISNSEEEFNFFLEVK